MVKGARGDQNYLLYDILIQQTFPVRHKHKNQDQTCFRNILNRIQRLHLVNIDFYRCKFSEC